MAIVSKFIGKGVGYVLDKYQGIVQDSAGVLTGPVNKLWRAKILLNRINSFPKDSALNGSAYNPNGVPGSVIKSSTHPIANQGYIDQRRVQLKHGYDLIDDTDPAQGRTVEQNKNAWTVAASTRQLNQVIIYNLGMSPYQFIVLQNRPTSIDFRGETSWANIKSMGRNTPMYHYTGSEDVVQFNISWYCNDPNNPAEVLTKCRLLESWTKSNGYQAAPPLLEIEWGNSDMFRDHLYILTSATYTLNNFRNASRLRTQGYAKIDYNLDLYPATATQELIFKRVSDHSLSWADVVDPDYVEQTKGINGN